LIVGFGLRLKNILKDNGIDINQVEIIISDVAIYCFKHKISFDTPIPCGYEALALKRENGIPAHQGHGDLISVRITIIRPL
jgi:hypothetical protein